MRNALSAISFVLLTLIVMVALDDVMHKFGEKKKKNEKEKPMHLTPVETKRSFLLDLNQSLIDPLLRCYGSLLMLVRCKLRTNRCSTRNSTHSIVTHS